MKKALKVALYTLSGLIIAVYLIVVASRLYKDKSGIAQINELSLLGYRPVIVVTGSMEPEIAIGSISLMKFCDIDEVSVDDIVMYKNTMSNINIIHRVVKINTFENGEKWLVTKGDANQDIDRIQVTSDILIGKIVKTYNSYAKYTRKFIDETGKINSWSVAQSVILLIVLMAVIILLIKGLIELIKYIKWAFLKPSKFYKQVKDAKEDAETAYKLYQFYSRIDLTDKTLRNRIRKARAIKNIKDTREMIDDLRKQYEKYININGYRNGEFKEGQSLHNSSIEWVYKLYEGEQKGD